MSTRREIEERKSKKKIKLVIDESPIKFIDIKTFIDDTEVMLSKNLIIKKKDLDNLIYSNKFNIKYSSTNDKITLYVETTLTPISVNDNNYVVKLDSKDLSSGCINVDIKYNTEELVQ